MKCTYDPQFKYYYVTWSFLTQGMNAQGSTVFGCDSHFDFKAAQKEIQASAKLPGMPMILDWKLLTEDEAKTYAEHMNKDADDQNPK